MIACGPINCPWKCHLIGGPWIAENPSCPFHGLDPVDMTVLSQDDVDRMCREEEMRQEYNVNLEP